MSGPLALNKRFDSPIRLARCRPPVLRGKAPFASEVSRHDPARVVAATMPADVSLEGRVEPRERGFSSAIVAEIRQLIPPRIAHRRSRLAQQPGDCSTDSPGFDSNKGGIVP